MKLTLVGLPLGKAEDISVRAMKTLVEADLIVCEDTRVLFKLWQKLTNLGWVDGELAADLMALNEFNEKEKVSSLLMELKRKNKPVLVSDAGLPTISDPGYRLVKAVIDGGGEIEIVPGPTAVMTSVAVSGFSSDRVLFLGFLAKKTSKKKKEVERLKKLKGEGLTVVIYESPHRIEKTITFLVDELGKEVEACLVRELTKEHEEKIRGSLRELKTVLEKRKLKGEMTLVLRLKD